MEKFTRIAEIEFSDIVLSTQDLGYKLRIHLKDKTFIDFFYSTKTKIQRFSIHWERKHLDKSIYRIDNTPDRKWRGIATFPIHFHSTKYENVILTPFEVIQESNLEDIFRSFLIFARGKLKS